MIDWFDNFSNSILKLNSSDIFDPTKFRLLLIQNNIQSNILWPHPLGTCQAYEHLASKSVRDAWLCMSVFGNDRQTRVCLIV